MTWTTMNCRHGNGWREEGKKKEGESWKCLIAVNRFMISVVNLCLHMLSRTKHEENYRQKEAHEGTRTKTYCLMRVRWILTR